MTERVILSMFVFPELLVLFGIIWIDLQYKSNQFRKQERKTAQTPKLVSVLLVFLSLGISLFFNYLMYIWYYDQISDQYLRKFFILNPLVVVLSMAFVLLNIKPNR